MSRGLPPLTSLIPSPQQRTSTTTTPPSIYPPPTRPREHSLLEKHAIASYSSQPARPPASLSVYELPTATFMWPSFASKAAEPLPVDPIIYVKYRPGQDKPTHSDSEHPDSSPTMSAHSSLWSEPSNLTARSTPASTPPREASRKRSSSSETDDNPASPSDRFLKRPRTSRHSPLPERIIPALAPSADLPPRLGERKLRRSFQTLGLASERSDAEQRGEAVAHTAHQSKSAHTQAPCPPARAATPPALDRAPARRRPAIVPMPVLLVDPSRKNDWLKYVRKVPQEEVKGGREWACIWHGLRDDGKTGDCDYKAKKHLVKRHIESKHLQLRGWQCTFPGCNRRISQKSNLETHMNTHTGATPHKCYYCGMRFKDPARRQRHMKEHGHETVPMRKARLAAEKAEREEAAKKAAEAGAEAAASEASEASDPGAQSDADDRAPGPST
ncbi:uncharacterized protein TRAVEDRAFT_44139 [Trametes versicolor FP-101664 SS1]|uniref:uncharacterized protein n=1 Tax=Trametes versicolor (strain FP-101664) TaxID=717944 RepID=UPI0004623E41|nr:uncharacterized protein TRAVEDRAFT_44139 [Trametes versicolor FP-101664 SS1]EIW61320.1 hypothetical protein TRAVEDRAFT_44139 [Trametes versicolor FP-101664 SS1]